MDLQTVFQLMAWIYSFSWSLSFYGQIILNYKLKNVEGLNLDFFLLNITGFFFYTLYNLYGFTISNQYTGQVEFADVFMASHGLFALSITGIQILIYPKGTNKLKFLTMSIVGMQFVVIILFSILVKINVAKESSFLSIVGIMGFYKIISVSLKYLPQLCWNYVRKSTKGWSIFNIICDLNGGIFSFLQTVLRSFFIKNYQLNVIKMLLGFVTIVYDTLFVLQHYLWYAVNHQQYYQQLDRVGHEQENTCQNIENSQLEDPSKMQACDMITKTQHVIRLQRCRHVERLT